MICERCGEAISLTRAHAVEKELLARSETIARAFHEERGRRAGVSASWEELSSSSQQLLLEAFWTLLEMGVIS